MLNKIEQLTKGERVRIRSTGQEVTVDQVSDYGFAVVKFNTGCKHRFLNHKLEKISIPVSLYNTN
ncbi:MAG: hypothetical protein OEY87_10460 [Gammaproteobacteria bacterium]|nr:hypothetical protein [Gammaproteobacteria bacterium]